MLRCSIEVTFDATAGKLTLSPQGKDDEVILDYLFTNRQFVHHSKKQNNGGSWVLSFEKKALATPTVVPPVPPVPSFGATATDDEVPF